LGIAFLISLAVHALIVFGLQIGAVEQGGGKPRRALEARLASGSAGEPEVLLKAIEGPVKSEVQDYEPPSPDAPSAETTPAESAPKAGMPEAAASPTMLDAPLPPDTTYYGLKEVDVRPRALSDPVYPEQAARLQIGGKVRVRLLLNENGGVDEATILGVDPPDWGFDTAVLEHLKTARFRPAMRKGRPVRSTVEYELEFSATEPRAHY
jgi:TonB family protein